MKKKKLQKKYVPYIYLLPWFFGILVFRLYPFINSFYLSFHTQRLAGEATFVGLDNYKMMLSDKRFWQAVEATAKYVIITVPLVMVVSLMVAFILNFKLKGVNFFRTAYYIPSILGGNVAVVTLWRHIWETNGLVNGFLGFFGMDPIPFLADPNWAMLVMCLLRAWQFGSTMVIFLAALQGVPRSLYEAGAIDGATKLKMFFKITIPMLTPVVLFNFVMVMINAFQEFNAPYLITDGGPMYSTYLFNVYIYETAFTYGFMGYASALSWVLFLVIMVFTSIVFKSSDKWVFYND